MAADISEQRLLASSSVIEGAAYLLHRQTGASDELYGLKCASSQSQNCPNSSGMDLYGLKCASSQSQNCPNSSGMDLYGLKCASSQSQNCPNSSLVDKVK